VNRSPVTGKIERIRLSPRRLSHADLDKASENNERIPFSSRSARAHRGRADRRVDRAPDRLLRARGASVGAGQRLGLTASARASDVYSADGVRPWSPKARPRSPARR